MAIYKRGQGFELGTTENKSSKWPERDSNPVPPPGWPLGHAASHAINQQATINKLFGEVSKKQQFSRNTSKVVHERPYKTELDFENW